MVDSAIDRNKPMNSDRWVVSILLPSSGSVVSGDKAYAILVVEGCTRIPIEPKLLDPFKTKTSQMQGFIHVYRFDPTERGTGATITSLAEYNNLILKDKDWDKDDGRKDLIENTLLEGQPYNAFSISAAKKSVEKWKENLSVGSSSFSLPRKFSIFGSDDDYDCLTRTEWALLQLQKIYPEAAPRNTAELNKAVKYISINSDQNGSGCIIS